MPERLPHLVILCDGLRAPPSAGFHVHLLSLARAAARHVPTKAFCWIPSSRDEGWEAWRAQEGDLAPEEYLIPLDASHAPRGGIGQKRHYLDVAWRWIDANAPPGSVIWVRGYTTALLLRRRMMSPRCRRDYTFLYDASSLLRLEAPHAPQLRFAKAKILLEEFLRRRFDKVRTLCDSMKSYLVETGIDAEKVVVIPVGSERKDVTWQPASKPTRLLYVGSAGAWQGLPILMRAMSRLERSNPDLVLDVVGATGASVEPVANVRFHGWVARDQMETMYLTHDLLLVPRPRSKLTDVVLPMKVPEAMTYGIPILTTDLAPIRWALGPDGAFYVSESTPELLADAIESALGDESRLARTGEAALARSRAFLWESIGENLGAILLPDQCATT